MKRAIFIQAMIQVIFLVGYIFASKFTDNSTVKKLIIAGFVALSSLGLFLRFREFNTKRILTASALSSVCAVAISYSVLFIFPEDYSEAIFI